jgi:hypothetical protein
LQFEKQKSTLLASKMANNYAKQTLLRSTIKAWHLVSQASWKRTIERRLELEQDRKIAQLEEYHQDKCNQLNSVIKTLEKQLEATKLAQVTQQEEMRSAFLRGVSALNAQAAGMFKTPVNDLIYHQAPLDSKPKTIVTKQVFTAEPALPKDVFVANEKPIKAYNIDGRTTLTATNGLVTRHIFKKETA